VVITGASGDAAALGLAEAANSVFRFGKAVLRVTPEVSLENLPLALRLTLIHLPRETAAALVCSGTACSPPTSDPKLLVALLKGKEHTNAAT